MAGSPGAPASASSPAASAAAKSASAWQRCGHSLQLAPVSRPALPQISSTRLTILCAPLFHNSHELINERSGSDVATVSNSV
eukprot:4693655-Pyramimonas_sp.AAC.1